MKKALYLLIIGALLLPIYVKANGFGPLLTGYKAYVSNVNGTILERESGEIEKSIKVPFETILEVYNEIEVKGEVYAIVEYNDYDSYYCKISDLRLVNEKVNLKDFYKEDKAKKLYVYKEGAYLYKGPSKIYGKVSEEQIPVGTTLTYEYSDSLFAYVTYNGKSGWVFTYPYPNGADEVYTVAIENPYAEGASVAEIPEYEYIFSTPNTRILSDGWVVNSKWSELKLSLKPLTKLKVNYYIYGIGAACYNVTYDEITGWACEGPDADLGQWLLPNLANTTMYVKSDMNYYKKILLNEDYSSPYDIFELKDKIGTIPKNTEVQIEYLSDADLYYIIYNNKEGYVIDGDFSISKTDDYFTAKTNLPVYDKIDGNETGHFLEAGKRYNRKYSFGYYGWQYIETKEFSGWVNAAENDDEYDVPSEPEIIIEKPTTTTTKRNESLKKTLSRSSVIIISILVATVVSTASLATIILINKKKNKR